MANRDEKMSVKEAAHFLGYKEHTVYTLQKGKNGRQLKGLREGNRLYFWKSELENYKKQWLDVPEQFLSIKEAMKLRGTKSRQSFHRSLSSAMTPVRLKMVNGKYCIHRDDVFFKSRTPGRPRNTRL